MEEIGPSDHQAYHQVMLQCASGLTNHTSGQVMVARIENGPKGPICTESAAISRIIEWYMLESVLVLMCTNIWIYTVV